MIVHLVAVWTLIYNSFLSYSQLFQISQIFENVFKQLPDSIVLSWCRPIKKIEKYDR